MRHKCEERDRIIEELKIQVQDLELRNRQLNDRVNDVIYSKAAEFKNKTIEKLKHSCENTEPNRIHQRCGDARLAKTLQDDHLTAQKALEDMQRQVRNNTYLN